MKSLVLILCSVLLLSGCATNQNHLRHNEQPSATATTYQVFQTMPDGSALAFECDKSNLSLCLGKVVLLSNSFRIPYFDGLKVTIKNPEFLSVYRYTANNSREMAVPVISSRDEASTPPLEASVVYNVIQVLPNGDALATECSSRDREFSQSLCTGYVALLPSVVDPVMFNDKHVTITAPAIVDLYRYESNAGMLKTVPVIVPSKLLSEKQ